MNNLRSSRNLEQWYLKMEQISRLEELQQVKLDLQSLQEHPGWARVRQILDQQCRLRRINVFQLHIGGLDNCFELARLQGEVAGLQYVGALVEVLIADASADVQRLLEDERKEQ